MKDDISIADKYGPAMTITDQIEADAYFARCVEHGHRTAPNRSDAEIEDVERSCIGYFAGYYDNETRERVERLFRCEHPVFGSIVKNGPPTSDQALLAGVIMGLAARGKRE